MTWDSGYIVILFYGVSEVLLSLMYYAEERYTKSGTWTSFIQRVIYSQRGARFYLNGIISQKMREQFLPFIIVSPLEETQVDQNPIFITLFLFWFSVNQRCTIYCSFGAFNGLIYRWTVQLRGIPPELTFDISLKDYTVPPTIEHRFKKEIELLHVTLLYNNI